MDLAPRLPRLFRHASGRGCFKFQGRFIYCGPWPAGAKRPPAEVEARYTALVWRAIAGSSLTMPPSPEGLTLNDCMAEFWQDAKVTKGKEFAKYKRATSFLLALCGELPVQQIGPRKILDLQRHLVDRGYTRQGCNKCVNLVRTALRWCVSRELFPVAQFHAIETVGPLLAGSTSAPESRPKGRVSDEVIEATLPHLPEMLRDMVRLQRLTGMRPGEVCGMTMGQIDRSERVWWYIPSKHKTAWRGARHQRVIGLGPQCQTILSRWIRFDPDQPLFSPAEWIAQRRTEMRAARKTKVQPSQESRAKEAPRKAPGDRWTSQSYCRAIHAAARKAGLAIWSPNQLRKAAAQTVCEVVSVEAAADMLGHSDSEVTRRHYLESAKSRIRETALKIG